MMATALTKAARLKPEVRLGQAISEFQADCSSREKATLRSYQAAGIPPSIRDVMQLTAEINRSAGLQGRCFGSRLTNILQAVQEFAALGDIVLGASQSLLACGIWALSIVKYSTYFEQLSDMLMAVGRSAPRYQLMGAVYPKSQRLGTSMLEYFITVVQLCHHVMKLSRKTAFGQWASTLTASLKGYQSDLELWATAIKEEVNLLMVQQLSLEAEDNSWFRSQITKRFESQSYARKLRVRQRVMDACSTYDYEQDWKRIRKLGTTTILETSAVYKHCKAPQDPQGLRSRTLVCIGKLGSGKSVVLANMVDDLNLDVRRKAVVAYFFCQHDSTQSLAPKTVIGSLARQLLQSANDFDAARDFLRDKRSLEVDDIVTLLKHLLPTQFEAFFVLDGLMHCDAEARQVILTSLLEIQEFIKLSLCVSVRPEPAGSLQELNQLPNRQFLSVEDNKSDIDAFINTELERCLKAEKLVINDPALILEIRDSLSQGAQGMFLWASLQIEALCLERTDADVRDAIANLPKDLSALYTTILRKSSVSGATYQSKILDLVAIACRPLTTEEMTEALGVIPWKTSWDPARRLNDMHATLSCCGSLLTVDEESSSIRVVHHSVKTYLFDQTGGGLDANRANQTMAEIIVTYLNYDVFSRHSSSVTAAVSFALKLLRLRKSNDKDVGYSLMQYLKASRATDMEWWQEHIWCLDPDTPNLHKLLINLLEAHGYDKPDSFGQTPLSHACQWGSLGLVDWLLVHGALHTDDLSGHSPLFWAINGRHIAVVESLLQSAVSPLTSAILMRDVEMTKCFLGCDRVDRNQRDPDGYTPLIAATLLNFVQAIPMFLSGPHTDIFAVAPSGDSAFHIAAANQSHTKVFNLLFEQARLEEKGSQSVLTANTKGKTPLWLAAANGNLEVIQSVCQYQNINLDVPNPRYIGIVICLANTSRVDINHLDKAGLSALWAAVFNDHEDVVQAMITMKGLDPDRSGVGAGTPLETAILMGKVNINRQAQDDMTPLQLAAHEGCEEIVAMLVSNRRIIHNRRGHHGVTPLWTAASRGHRIDLNFPRMHGDTALGIAAFKGHVEVVQILISTGQVDLNRKDQNGTTPLWAAADNGHTKIVNILASTDGVDVECPNATGTTPLWRAASKGYYHIVQALVNTGRVDINSVDVDGTAPLFSIDIGVDLNGTSPVYNSHTEQTPLWIASSCPGIQLNQRDREGYTPLGIAAKMGHASIVAILASIPGVELFQIARQAGHEAVVNVLKSLDHT
ncbi:NACHT domain protein [Aspergillus piperis CBS 112811]|uniref:NACHT domain protein n=1 Tax=Aspergillus piperis CBS 112811 TaxID=1448313 RepID=A0A8G1QX00_9EURO|nr:NACHT domain protein [Aspergillus piperis CBS 112811]RAH55239.1 NACHT domain protein [Aspergillus piperis CBS 112811]